MDWSLLILFSITKPIIGLSFYIVVNIIDKTRDGDNLRESIITVFKSKEFIRACKVAGIAAMLIFLYFTLGWLIHTEVYMKVKSILNTILIAVIVLGIVIGVIAHIIYAIRDYIKSHK